MNVKSQEISDIKAFFLAVVLSLIFTISLTYATLELPRFLHRILIKIIPEYPIPIGLEKLIEPLKPYGYAALVMVLLLILLGFLTKRFRITVLGSVIMQLTTFGYFAFTMFVFAGIGIVRLIWLPMLEISPMVLRLGDVVLLPLFVIGILAAILGYRGIEIMHLYSYASIVAMFIGALVLFMGTMTWLYGKFKGVELVDFWIYKYSRHPQYLGFLIYSYGLLLLASIMPAPKGGYFPLPTFPWLIAALLVIDVAILEEIELRKKFGEQFNEYKKRVPFMLPLPKIFEYPIKLITLLMIKKNFPENWKEVTLITVVYTILLVVLSIPLSY